MHCCNYIAKERFLFSVCQIEAHKDPFLRSIAYWVLEDYSRALDTLLEQPCNNPYAGATCGECDAGKSLYFSDIFSSLRREYRQFSE